MAAPKLFLNQIRRLNSLAESPMKYQHLFNPKITPPRQAWLENFVGKERELLDIVTLHPRVFSVFPRIDSVSEVIQWQQNYRTIDYTCMPTRNELPGGTKKPWPQKGTGRARHGSVNSPIFLKGGWARGPRGPVTGYRPLAHSRLVSSLKTILSIKMAQDDIKIVDSIDSFELDDPDALEDAFAKRYWGPSVLIVDKRELFPEKLSLACAPLNHINTMNTAEVNTLSLAKHETLVITLRAIREIEDKLLFQMMRVDLSETHSKYRDD